MPSHGRKASCTYGQKKSPFISCVSDLLPRCPEGSLSVHKWTWRHLQPLKAEIPCRLSLQGAVASPGWRGTLLAIFTATNVMDEVLDVLLCGKRTNLGWIYCVQNKDLNHWWLFSCSRRLSLIITMVQFSVGFLLDKGLLFCLWLWAFWGILIIYQNYFFFQNLNLSTTSVGLWLNSRVITWKLSIWWA